MKNKPRKRYYDISVENCCSQCKRGWVSDIFQEWMCNEPADDVILYPETKGKNECPYFEKEE